MILYVAARARGPGSGRAGPAWWRMGYGGYGLPLGCRADGHPRAVMAGRRRGWRGSGGAACGFWAAGRARLCARCRPGGRRRQRGCAGCGWEVRSRRLSLLMALCTLMREGRLSNGEEVLLGHTIDLLDERLGSTREPTVGDVLAVIEQGPDTLRSAARASTPARYQDRAAGLIFTLDLLCTGSLAGVFDGPTSRPIDLNAPGVARHPRPARCPGCPRRGTGRAACTASAVAWGPVPGGAARPGAPLPRWG